MEEFDINNTAWVVLEEQSDPVWTTGGKRDELIAEIKGVGNTTLNVVINENDNIINISKPLLSDGILSDYLDLENGCIYRNLDIDENTGLLKKTSVKEDIVINKITVGTGTNIITTQTEIKPSKITAGLRSFDSGIKFLRLNCKVPPTLSELGEINYPVFVPDEAFEAYSLASNWSSLLQTEDIIDLYKYVNASSEPNYFLTQPFYMRIGDILIDRIGLGFFYSTNEDGTNAKQVLGHRDYGAPAFWICTCEGWYIHEGFKGYINSAPVKIVRSASYLTIHNMYNEVIKKRGVGIYDGDTSFIIKNSNNLLYPENMIYWAGYGKLPYAGDKAHTIEPEDMLDTSLEIEDALPLYKGIEASEEDRVILRRQAIPTEDNSMYSKIVNDNEILSFFNKSLISDVQNTKMYAWNLGEITSIPDYAYSLMRGDQLKIIDLTCLKYCKSLLTIPNYGFYLFDNLKKFHLPECVTTIQSHGFGNTGALKEVYISDLAKYLSISFADADSCPIKNGKTTLFLNGHPLTEKITIPQEAPAISSYAFYGYTKVKSYFFMEGPTSIGQQSFYSNSALESVYLSDSIETIGQQAFYNDRELYKIIIGSGIKTISSDAFVRFSASSAQPIATKRIILIKSITPPTIGIHTFADYYADSAPLTGDIYIPIGSKDAYLNNSQWPKYSENLQEYNMDCDPLGLISDEGPRACYCPMSNLDIIDSTDYNNGIFTAKSGTEIGNTVLMRNYDSDGNYIEETWTVQSDLTISK